jgi:hypothetical protein
MRYQKRKTKQIVIGLGLLGVILFACEFSFAQKSSIYGTAAFFDKNTEQYLVDAGNFELRFRFRHRKIAVTTDQNGDFALSDLQAGRYCLERVKSSNDRIARISSKQIRCINLVAGKGKEFNIMLLRD